MESFKKEVINDLIVKGSAEHSDSQFILLTSVRRSITDLTKEGRLIKCQWSESKEGAYGKLNRVWRYNENYIAPINPVKVKMMRSITQTESKTETHYADIRDMHKHPDSFSQP